MARINGVAVGRFKDSEGNLGCCTMNSGEVYCQWWVNGHPFCTEGCDWVYTYVELNPYDPIGDEEE